MADGSDDDDGDDQHKETPLPRKKVVVLMLFQLSEALSINMLFPIVPFLVRGFDDIDENDSSEVSYYASIIASTFNFAQFLSSFWWGAYSDRFGRRPVMLFGMAGSVICLVAFGMVRSLFAAVAIRAMHGLLNGNAGVTKTYMREITDSSNQTRGMALFGTFWGIGSFIGPAIGGFLSFPADKMPGLFPPGGIFDQNPFLLPFLAAAFVTLLGWLLGYAFLAETVERPEPLYRCLPCLSTSGSAVAPMQRSAPGGGAGKRRRRRLSLRNSVARAARREKHRRQQYNDDEVELVAADGDEEDEEEARAKGRRAAIGDAVRREVDREKDQRKQAKAGKKGKWREQQPKTNKRGPRPPGCCSSAGRRSLLELLRGKGVCLVLVCYTCIAFVMACLQELFPLWASLPPEEGGLGFVTTEIGAVQMVMGIALILYTTLILPIVGKCCGVTRMYQSFSGIYVPVCVLTPYINVLVDHKRQMWAGLVVLYVFRSIAGPSTFTAIGCLVNNAAAENVGAVNGIATSATALARALGPAISGQMLGWSLARGLPPPMDYHFPFYVLAFIVLVSSALTCLLPPGMDIRIEDRGRRKSSRRGGATGTSGTGTGDGDGDGAGRGSRRRGWSHREGNGNRGGEGGGGLRLSPWTSLKRIKDIGRTRTNRLRPLPGSGMQRAGASRRTGKRRLSAKLSSISSIRGGGSKGKSGRHGQEYSRLAQAGAEQAWAEEGEGAVERLQERQRWRHNGRGSKTKTPEEFDGINAGSNHESINSIHGHGHGHGRTDMEADTVHLEALDDYDDDEQELEQPVPTTDAAAAAAAAAAVAATVNGGVGMRNGLAANAQARIQAQTEAQAAVSAAVLPFKLKDRRRRHASI